ncbi:MAG: hypothetical protein ABI203_02730 [Mucilaginibacter sp.]
MEVIYSPKALEDLKYWQNSGNKIIQKRIINLINAIQQALTLGLASLNH